MRPLTQGSATPLGLAQPWAMLFIAFGELSGLPWTMVFIVFGELSELPVHDVGKI